MSFVCHSYVTGMSFAGYSYELICHSFVLIPYSYFTRMSFVCHLNIIVCRSLITHMHLYVIVIHLYILVCHSSVTRMYSCVICMLFVFVCTRMPFVFYWYVLLCHSYVIYMSLTCHLYVTTICSYAIRILLVCTYMSLVSTRISLIYDLTHEPFQVINIKTFKLVENLSKLSN